MRMDLTDNNNNLNRVTRLTNHAHTSSQRFQLLLLSDNNREIRDKKRIKENKSKNRNSNNNNKLNLSPVTMTI